MGEGPERALTPLHHLYIHLTKIYRAKYLSVHYLYIILTHFVSHFQRKQFLLSIFGENTRKLAGKGLQKAEKLIQNDEVLAPSLTAKRKQEHPQSSREDLEP